jgi:hypothetical protein
MHHTRDLTNSDRADLAPDRRRRILNNRRRKRVRTN